MSFGRREEKYKQTQQITENRQKKFQWLDVDSYKCRWISTNIQLEKETFKQNQI